MYLYILLAALVVYQVFRRIKHYQLSKKWHCEPLYFANFGFLGTKFIKYQIDLDKLGHLLEKQTNLFKDLNRNTFGVNIFFKNLVTTRSPEIMKALLATQYSEFGLGPRIRGLNPLIGHGIFASDGDRWKASREMLRPQFAREKVGHIQTLEPHIQHLVKILKRKDGEVIDFQEYAHKLTMDAASDFLFGESTNSLAAEDGGKVSGDLDEEEFSEAFSRIQDVTTLRIAAGPLGFLVNTKQFKKDLEVVHSFTQHYVDVALNTPIEDFDKLSKGGYVLLYEIVKKTRDRKIIQDELLSMLLAGRNTTAGLISFLFFELSRNPEILNKLREEIHQQFGSGDDVDFDKITFESMKRCTYLKYCINETLRLYPPIARNLRVAFKDTTLPKGGGDGEAPIFVPKGTHIVFSIYSCHRIPEIYGKDCDVYRPERWENLKPGWAFMPFGSGPRICLGQQFALTEASYVTIRLLQSFSEFKGVKTEYPPKRITNATTRLLEGCQVSIR